MVEAKVQANKEVQLRGVSKIALLGSLAVAVLLVGAVPSEASAARFKFCYFSNTGYEVSVKRASCQFARATYRSLKRVQRFSGRYRIGQRFVLPVRRTVARCVVGGNNRYGVYWVKCRSHGRIMLMYQTKQGPR